MFSATRFLQTFFKRFFKGLMIMDNYFRGVATYDIGKIFLRSLHIDFLYFGLVISGKYLNHLKSQFRY